MTKNVSVGGKSYEVSEKVLEKIKDLLEDDETIEKESLEDMKSFKDDSSGGHGPCYHCTWSDFFGCRGCPQKSKY